MNETNNKLNNKKTNKKINVKFFKIIILTMFVCFVATYFVNVNADFWGDANKWYGTVNLSDASETSGVRSGIFKELADMINILGTSVIVIATIILGVKYMLGSVESKADVKENLITLLVACLFFFGWQAIRDLLAPNNVFVFTNGGTFAATVGSVFSTVLYMLKFIVISAVIYVGVKYIFAGASGKADLKSKSGLFVIGIIMALATSNFLTVISNIINEIL
jgi:hypothetical protein